MSWIIGSGFNCTSFMKIHVKERLLIPNYYLPVFKKCCQCHFSCMSYILLWGDISHLVDLEMYKIFVFLTRNKDKLTSLNTPQFCMCPDKYYNYLCSRINAGNIRIFSFSSSFLKLKAWKAIMSNQHVSVKMQQNNRETHKYSDKPLKNCPYLVKIHWTTNIPSTSIWFFCIQKLHLLQCFATKLQIKTSQQWLLGGYT